MYHIKIFNYRVLTKVKKRFISSPSIFNYRAPAKVRKKGIFFDLQFSDQKGIALLFIVLITSLILSIGLGLTALLIQGMRITGEIGYSVVAFYAADTGIEEALYDLYQNPSPSPLHSGNLDSAYYQTFAKCDKDTPPGECLLGDTNIDPNCDEDALKYCLKSLGSYQRVKRAIEIKY